jgi:RNA polymerase sigma-70 factor (ECF subfamily)
MAVIEIPDEILMRRAQAGEAQAFEELYGRYSMLALRVARSACANPSLAEDAVQEAFLAMWARRSSYRADRASFAAWSMTIARNRAIDSTRRDTAALRREQAVARHASSAVADGCDVAVIARSENAALYAALRELPRAQAQVIALAYFGGLTHAEIAAHLAIPEGTVKGRARLGLRRLRAKIGEAAGYGAAPSPSPLPSTA